MKEVGFSFPEDKVHLVRLYAEANGFFGKYWLSNYVKHLLFREVGVGGLLHKAPPILIQPASFVKYQWYTDYAMIKNFPNVEAYALYATGGMTKKVKLTDDEKEEYAQLLINRGADPKAVLLLRERDDFGESVE